MDRKFNVAVVGASGLVGEAVVDFLGQREFPVENLYLLASDNSAGSTVFFKEKSHRVELLSEFDFSQVDIAFFCVPAEVSEGYAQQAADAGAVVIDSSVHFRLDADVPLVNADVNPEAVAEYSIRNLIASPGSLVNSLVPVLVPLYRQLGVRSIELSACQAVSSAGRGAVEELAKQTAALLNSREPQSERFAKQIAFNVLPQVGAADDSGYSSEELSVIREVQKLLSDETIRVQVSCTQVPVFFGHAQSVQIQTESPTDTWEVTDILSAQAGVSLSEEGEFATPVTEAAGNEELFVSRVRGGLSSSNDIGLYIVADNIKKGAALNSVQIAELLITQYL